MSDVIASALATPRASSRVLMTSVLTVMLIQASSVGLPSHGTLLLHLTSSPSVLCLQGHLAGRNGPQWCQSPSGLLLGPFNALLGVSTMV